MPSRNRTKVVYLATRDKAERRRMISDASCDHDVLLGYLRRAHAENQATLAKIRTTWPARSRSERLLRKADFLKILARMAERSHRILDNFPG